MQPPWRERRAQLLHDLQEGTSVGPPGDRAVVTYRSGGPGRPTGPLCFCPTDTHLVFVALAWERPGSSQPQARVWLRGREEGSALEEQEVPLPAPPGVLCVCHVPPLRLLAAYCSDGSLRLFGDHCRKLAALAATPSPHACTCLCYSAHTGELVTGGLGVLTWWALGTGPPMAPSPCSSLRVPGGELVQAVQAAAHSLLVLCESAVQLYNTRSRVVLQALRGCSGPPLCACLLRGTPERLCAGDSAGYVQAWSLRTGRCVQCFRAHTRAVSAVAARPSEHSLLTASPDGLVKEWGWPHGDLLRQLELGEPVLQLGCAGPTTVYCYMPGGLLLLALRDLHRLFHATGSALRHLARVPCGVGRACVVAAGEDGAVRLLSPVTGELLRVTWPYEVMDRALDVAYDPEHEQLAVTVGGTNIYVLDTSRNPCLAVHVLRVAPDCDDAVLCLAFCRLHAGPRGWVFVGCRSGCVRALSPRGYLLCEQVLHQGAVEALCGLHGDDDHDGPPAGAFLCSCGADECILLSSLMEQGSELSLQPVRSISATGVQHLLLVPGAVCAVTRENRLHVWSLERAGERASDTESAPLHASTITSFDYCTALRLLVTGAADGSVRFWSLAGALVAELGSSLRLGPICFGSRWGDLLAGCQRSLFLIPCSAYLPRERLRELTMRCLLDDAPEEPLRFMPSFLHAFKSVLVPTYQLEDSGTARYQGMELLASYKHVEVAHGIAQVRGGTKVTARPPAALETYISSTNRVQPGLSLQHTLRCQAEPACKQHSPSEPKQPPARSVCCPIAPDGLVPNSVVRACVWPGGVPDHEPGSMQQRLPEREHMEPCARWSPSATHEAEQPEEGPLPCTQGPPEALLASVAHRHGLLEQSLSLEAVVRGLLQQLEAAGPGSCSQCSSALVQLTEGGVLPLPPPLRAEAYEALVTLTGSAQAARRRAAWQALAGLVLLSHRDLPLLAHALLDADGVVRHLARALLRTVASITSMDSLREAVRALPASEGASSTPISHASVKLVGTTPGAEVASMEELLQALEERLTSGLSLAEEPCQSSTEPEDQEYVELLELPVEPGQAPSVRKRRAASGGRAGAAVVAAIDASPRCSVRTGHKSGRFCSVQPLAPSSTPPPPQDLAAKLPRVQQKNPKVATKPRPPVVPSPLQMVAANTLGPPELPGRPVGIPVERRSSKRTEVGAHRISAQLKPHAEPLLWRNPRGVQLPEKPMKTPVQGQPLQIPVPKGPLRILENAQVPWHSSSRLAQRYDDVHKLLATEERRLVQHLVALAGNGPAGSQWGSGGDLLLRLQRSRFHGHPAEVTGARRQLHRGIAEGESPEATLGQGSQRLLQPLLQCLEHPQDPLGCAEPLGQVSAVAMQQQHALCARRAWALRVHSGRPQRAKPDASGSLGPAGAHWHHSGHADGASGPQTLQRVSSGGPCSVASQAKKDPVGKAWLLLEASRLKTAPWSPAPRALWSVEGAPWPPAPRAPQPVEVEEAATQHQEGGTGMSIASPSGQHLGKRDRELRRPSATEESSARWLLGRLLRLHRGRHLRGFLRGCSANASPPARFEPLRAPWGLLQEPGAPGERVLCRIHGTGRSRQARRPMFQAVAPLSYRNNVHAQRARGKATFGVLALRWRSQGAVGSGALPPLRLAPH